MKIVRDIKRYWDGLPADANDPYWTDLYSHRYGSPDFEACHGDRDPWEEAYGEENEDIEEGLTLEP